MMCTNLIFYVFIAALLSQVINCNYIPKRPEKDDEFYFETFPDDFLWGLATSSYQIEGAWNINDKGENIWDNFTHSKSKNIADHKNGDVACDSYHKYEEDVQLLKDMGAHFYRFSISWSRILPDGTKNKISRPGIDYYNRLINALVAKGIKPMVTLYHWDLPQPLMDIGGWPNESLAPYFEDYARICFENFGDRVKYWITFNEPWIFCQLGWGVGVHAPGIANPPVLPYLCAHTVIKSHGLAYRIYDAEFRKIQNGSIGMSLDSGWAEPVNLSKPKDVEASNRAMQFKYGWFAHPLTYGEYPLVMRELVDSKSFVEGRNESRLPTFNTTWTNIINGTLDFYGLNHYSSYYVYSDAGGPPGILGDQNVGGYGDPAWPSTAADWLKVVPWGFRKVLNWIGKEYNNAPIYVTENGFADRDIDGLNDTGRVNYYRLYTNEMLKSIKIDGVNVKGYTAWSLIDNFEWTAGYTQRFGVHYINFSDPNLARVPKDSAKFLTKLFKDNGYFDPKSH